MPKQRITVIIGLTLALAGSCNSSHKVGEGVGLSGEKPYDGKDIVSQPTTVSSEGIEAPGVVAEQSEPAPAVEEDDDDIDNKTAMEPVPIGGAYLTCLYQDGQKQGSESYRMDCEVAPLLEVTVPIASAAFYKIDAQGNRSPLGIINQDLLALKWVVQENLATMPLSQVQVVLSVPGFLSATLTTTVGGSISLAPSLVYWLGGEPNGLNPEEDCVEFVPLNGKINHQNFSGLTSGPLGRMNDIACTANFNFLCRNISAGANAPKWAASANTGAFANGATACSQGYAFSVPLNDGEVNEVMALVDRLDIKLWINLSDSAIEGSFRGKFR
ncbi:hypothetical protein [Oligoflexus tunisiensis]|uniref:hypothetical protein n=1 Tax=Oligoflexus tunisiensis TaxID=708132 RepID=UPI00114C9D16|nr:hypothetical protein [Oligoflexus tunisiensis]